MKSAEQIKEELSKQYFGKEAEQYDFVRHKDPRRMLVVNIQAKITKKLLKKAGGKNILDVACGTGRFFPLYAPREIYGIDVSSEMLKQAAKRKKVKIKKLQVADAEHLPFKDQTFDVVNTSQFIMHTPYYRKIIKEMTRVTKIGGSLIIDFPNKYSLSNPFTKHRIRTGVYRHYNLFTKKQIYQIAKENNLEIKDIYGTTIFTPMMFPKKMVGFSKSFNSFLIKILPQFSYVFYVRFVKK